MSLKEIAKQTGTSISTVSRVLNHPEHRCNNPALYEKIWETAKLLNYIPNTSARNLRLGTPLTEKPFTVDIFLTRFNSLHHDAFFQELHQCVKEELLTAGCLYGNLYTNLDMIQLSKEKEENEYIPYKTSKTNKISKDTHVSQHTGLIILGKCPSHLIPFLKKRYHCIVGIDRNPTSYEYDEVYCDGTVAAETAIDYLISLGHKNIAYIGDCNEETRYIGYYQTMLNNKLPLNHTNVYPTNQTKEEGYNTMLSILEAPVKPSAIFCANDMTALGVLKALKHKKKRDYHPSIISIDNIEHSQHTNPLLTTIDIPKKEMGHWAVLLLTERRKCPSKQHVRIELPCTIIKRDSCDYFFT